MVACESEYYFIIIIHYYIFFSLERLCPFLSLRLKMVIYRISFSVEAILSRVLRRKTLERLMCN